MSDALTLKMLELYQQSAPPTMFLTGLFQTPPQNFYNSSEVEIDISRTDEDISIVVQDFTDGGRVNSLDLYTNKRFKPPIHKETFPLNAFDLMNRQAGATPFDDINFQATANLKAVQAIAKISEKIQRSIELQASQILQTAVVSLKDGDGNVIYTLDFKGKVSHFTNAAAVWSDTAATPLADLESLAETIRNDGLQNPDQILMGSVAFDNFVKNDDVQKRFDNRRYELGTIAPMAMRGNGGNYRGQVTIGNYNMDIWSYGGRYKDPETGNKVTYIAPDKVIMRASGGRLDATFGAIPTFGNPAAGILPFMPPRITDQAGGMDIFTNAWLTPDREQLIITAGSRPLLIPTAIDTYGCLTTE